MFLKKTPSVVASAGKDGMCSGKVLLHYIGRKPSQPTLLMNLEPSKTFQTIIETKSRYFFPNFLTLIHLPRWAAPRLWHRCWKAVEVTCCCQLCPGSGQSYPGMYHVAWYASKIIFLNNLENVSLWQRPNLALCGFLRLKIVLSYWVPYLSAFPHYAIRWGGEDLLAHFPCRALE